MCCILTLIFNFRSSWKYLSWKHTFMTLNVSDYTDTHTHFDNIMLLTYTMFFFLHEVFQLSYMFIHSELQLRLKTNISYFIPHDYIYFFEVILFSKSQKDNISQTFSSFCFNFFVYKYFELYFHAYNMICSFY